MHTLGSDQHHGADIDQADRPKSCAENPALLSLTPQTGQHFLANRSLEGEAEFKSNYSQI